MAVPFRVVLSSGNLRRKFFSLFEGKDGSLYIHANRDTNIPWKAPNLEKVGESLKLDLKNPNVYDFEPHKISFHPSGYIHITDKRGNRFKDGTRGPSFEEMEDHYLFCILAPCEIENLPPFDGKERGMLVELAFPRGVDPFFVTLALLKNGDPVQEPEDTNLINRFILPLKSGLKLTFALRRVAPMKPNERACWPEYPFFLLRTAA